MKAYRFEIVRRKNSRYGWRVVAIDGARERVIARSPRSYRRRKRAVGAIEALQTAEVVDKSGPRDRDGFPLPATSFRRVAGVLPLIVAASPVDYEIAARQRGDARAKEDVALQQDDQAQAAPQQAAQKGEAEAKVKTLEAKDKAPKAKDKAPKAKDKAPKAKGKTANK